MRDIFDIPEEIPVTSFEQEETFGIVHKVFFTEENKSPVVNIQFATEGKEAPHLRTVQYKKIFTEGRFAFQRFCEDFSAVMNDDSVDLSKALGKLCVTSYNPEVQNFLLEYVPDSEAPEYREYFRKLIIPEPEPVPPMIANYWYMPYYRGKEMFHAEFLGFITDYKVFPDRWDKDDETLCLDITFFNGGIPRKTQYYLNRIYGEGHYDLMMFGSDFDILDEDDTLCPEDAFLIPCSIMLKSSNGKLYARSIEPFCFENDYEAKQAKLLISWHKNQMQKEDEPKFKPVSRGRKHD